MHASQQNPWQVRALGAVTLVLFTVQAIAFQAACQCGLCNQPVRADHTVAPVAAEQHACCHQHDSDPAAAENVAGEQIHAAKCDCGDHAERAPVIAVDAKVVAAGADALVQPVSTSFPDVAAGPMSAPSAAWRYATGPPGIRDALYLRFHALLI